MKINKILGLAVKNLKRNKTNILFLLLIIILSVTTIVGFSFYRSLISFWEDSTKKSYDFNLIAISSGTESVDLIAKSLKDNEHVRDVFYFNEYMSVGLFENYITDNSNGEVRLIGTIPNTKKIIYGQDLNDLEEGIICPSNFWPDSMIYYGNYDSNNVINLEEKIGDYLNFKYIDQYDVSLKLLGIFDSSYDYSMPNICYVNHSTLKKFNKEYQDEVNNDTHQAFILLDDINNAEIVLKDYKNIEYSPAKYIKTELGDKILKITNFSSIFLAFILFVFCYVICSRRIVKEAKNIGILKICGYDNKIIKAIFDLENLIVIIISTIMSLLLSSFILNHIPIWFFSKDPFLSLISVKTNISFIIISIIIVIMVTFISTRICMKEIDLLDISEIVHE